MKSWKVKVLAVSKRERMTRLQLVDSINTAVLIIRSNMCIVYTRVRNFALFLPAYDGVNRRLEKPELESQSKQTLKYKKPVDNMGISFSVEYFHPSSSLVLP